MKTKNTSRRAFLKKASVAAGGFMIVPRFVLGGPGYIAPSDQIRIATVGAGGKGYSDTWRAAGLKKEKGKPTEQIIALCDVDFKAAERTFNLFPDAKRYKDYRKMLEEMDDEMEFRGKLRLNDTDLYYLNYMLMEAEGLDE